MRYFFHVHEDGVCVADEEGQECGCLDDARAAALAGARSIIAAEVMAGKLPLDGKIEVGDASGRRVLELPFADAVVIEFGARA